MTSKREDIFLRANVHKTVVYFHNGKTEIIWVGTDCNFILHGYVNK